LPVVAIEHLKSRDSSVTVEIRDIQWNIELDPQLFDTTPPDGYTDATEQPPTVEKQVRLITEALKVYAEASGGHYPGEKTIGISPTINNFQSLLGLTKWPGKGDPNSEKMEKVFNGFEQSGQILDHRPEAIYFGKTVGPGDTAKILMRWKLDDGRYEVIFGDLRSETVTAERLHALEEKPE
jgi:hypothetical protein